MEWQKWTTILITLLSVLFVATILQLRQELHEGFSEASQQFRDVDLNGAVSAASQQFKQLQLHKQISAVSQKLPDLQLNAWVSATSQKLPDLQLNERISAAWQKLGDLHLNETISVAVQKFQDLQLQERISAIFKELQDLQLQERFSAALQKLRDKLQYSHDEDEHIRVMASALVKHEKEIQFLREALAAATPIPTDIKQKKTKRDVSEKPQFPGLGEKKISREIRSPDLIDNEETDPAKMKKKVLKIDTPKRIKRVIEIAAPKKKKKVIELNIKNPAARANYIAKRHIDASKDEVDKVLQHSVEGKKRENDYEY